MPVGKTFPTNPSIPQKEARSFSIKDEKTPIILSPDEMSPAGKADLWSCQKQSRQRESAKRPSDRKRSAPDVFPSFPQAGTKRKSFPVLPGKKQNRRLRKYARRERQTLQPDRPSESGGQNSANAETVRRVKQPGKSFCLIPIRRLYRQFNRRGHKTNRNFQEPRSEWCRKTAHRFNERWRRRTADKRIHPRKADDYAGNGNRTAAFCLRLGIFLLFSLPDIYGDHHSRTDISRQYICLYNICRGADSRLQLFLL